VSSAKDLSKVAELDLSHCMVARRRGWSCVGNVGNFIASLNYIDHASRTSTDPKEPIIFNRRLCIVGA